MRPRTLCPLPAVTAIIRVIVQSSPEQLVVKGTAPTSQAGEAGRQSGAVRCLNRKWMVFPGHWSRAVDTKTYKNRAGKSGATLHVLQTQKDVL